MWDWSQLFQQNYKFTVASTFSLTYWGLCFAPMISQSAIAQIVPDNTLPSNSAISVDGSNLIIEKGTAVGNNLFHSFQEFSLATGNTAYFNNANTIENILTRVTGSNISNIDGLIRTNGEANLFLINPNGIVFGENAALDVGGAFFSSTANGIIFEDGSEFSAIAPNSPPLLTVNMPVGLNMGTNSGAIKVEGTGNNIYYDFDLFLPVTSDRPAGIQVNQGETIALVGNGINLQGGNITAEEGRIELGSINQEGIVNLIQTEDGLVADYSNIQDFGDINLTDAASADASGNGGGIIQLVGENISLVDGAVVRVDTLGDGDAGLIKVQAQETLELLRDNPDNGFWTSIFAHTAEFSLGSGSNIQIESKNLNLIDGGQISTITYGDGLGGDIEIQAQSINLDGFNEDEFGIIGSSGIFATTEFFAFGDGGDIIIETQQLTLDNEAQVGVLTWGEGSAGNILIDAQSISSNNFGFISAVAQPDSFGNAGNITITTEDLFLADGGQILSDTFGDGNAGQIEIEAETIEAIGATDPSDDFTTGIFSATAPETFGNAGLVSIEAQTISLSNGAQIQSATSGAGNGGQVIIETDSLALKGFNARGNTAILSSATEGVGNGGNIEIVTEDLTIEDGATISASNFSTRNRDLAPGEGFAGAINIQAQSITLESELAEQQSSISAATFNAGGGNINIVADEILATDNSLITASTQGAGLGGNIEVQAKEIDLRDRSLINSATTNTGNGGVVSISSDLLKLTSGAEITTSSTGTGNAGNINIDSNTIQASRGSIAATANESGGGDISIDSELVQLEKNSSISTSVFDSVGGGGDINISSDTVLAKNNSDIRANAVLGSGGNINITTEIIFTSSSSDIDASSRFGLDGTVEITNPDGQERLSLTPLPENVSNPEGLITASCPVNKKNVLVVSGKGGLAENPQSYLFGQTLWRDLRLDTQLQAKELQPQLVTTETELQQNTEANGLLMNTEGALELVAHLESANQTSSWYQVTNCRDLSRK